MPTPRPRPWRSPISTARPTARSTSWSRIRGGVLAAPGDGPGRARGRKLAGRQRRRCLRRHPEPYRRARARRGQALAGRAGAGCAGSFRRRGRGHGARRYRRRGLSPVQPRGRGFRGGVLAAPSRRQGPGLPSAAGGTLDVHRARAQRPSNRREFARISKTSWQRRRPIPSWAPGTTGPCCSPEGRATRAATRRPPCASSPSADSARSMRR